MLVPVLFSIWDMAWVLIVGGIGIVCSSFLLMKFVDAIRSFWRKRQMAKEDSAYMRDKIELIQQKIHRLEQRRKQGKKN